ncbi:HD domain-containing protein [Rosistilla oblonga]|uniref:HD domain-containing protein n=1 Tax=Rosistilla oblonga TaxID=2527990 RepID=UPI003A98631E
MNRQEMLSQIPELLSFAASPRVVRIPPEMNVPMTDRAARLLDTPPLRRLSQVSQLGLVGLVYPGATHSRMEHSLGVYRNALMFLQRLVTTKRFAEVVDPRGAERFLLASLLHDVGHWPFCHPIEDMRLLGVPRHEQRARRIIGDAEIADRIRTDWQIEPDEVCDLLDGKDLSDENQALSSLLSGPIDVDKMDYLIRDSLHAGVPYGRNFDTGRLIGSLAIHPSRPRLAITDKGRTAAEMMVFSRYIMFSEVYWHPTVRSATAMLQRAIYQLHERLDMDSMCELTDAPWIERLLMASAGTDVQWLTQGLFGPKRRLFKEIGQFSVLDSPQIHASLAGRPYPWLVRCSESFARLASAATGRRVGPTHVLIDAPPQKLEVDINVDVVDEQGVVRTLGDVSPVAAVLARQQFDNFVKRVRIFVCPELRDSITPQQAREILEAAVEQTPDAT